MYHAEANKIYAELLNQLPTFKGGTSFNIGNIKIEVQGKGATIYFPAHHNLNSQPLKTQNNQP
jgi:hypothetical protein